MSDHGESSEEVSADLVSSGTIFDGLSNHDRRRIIESSKQITLPAGWSPVWADTPGDAAYILHEGEVAISQDGDVIAQLGPGDIFGEAALLRHRLRSATVSARTDLTVLRIDGEDFSRLIEEIPAFGVAVERLVEARMGGQSHPRAQS